MTQVIAKNESQLVAEAAAAEIIKLQNEAIASTGSFHVAVSGGSLVSALRKGLVGNTEAKFGKWKIFFSDERLVKLDDADSNYGLLKKDLLDHIKGEQPQVFTVKESLLSESDAVSKDYQDQIVKNIPANAQGVPVFDLILLGCGPDGHTCSLFPGHKLLKEETKFVATIEDSPKPPPRRITITFPVLKAAKAIAFVAEGAGKAPVLKQIFEEPEPTLPSAMVNKIATGPVFWFVSDSAVEGVNLSKI